MDQDRRKIITVIGSGGKTTVIYKEAARLRGLGKKVLVTTTTHMRCEEEYMCLTGRPEDICGLLQAEGYCIAGIPAGKTAAGSRSALETKGGNSISGQPENKDESEDKDGGSREASGEEKKGEKFGPLPRDVYVRVCEAADVVLVEGDGSRGLPVKYPGAHEPVIPENTTEIWLVTGMWALGQPLGEVTHRKESAMACLSQKLQQEITLDTRLTLTHMSILLEEGYLKPLAAGYPQIPVRIVPGQADSLYRKAAGAMLAAGFASAMRERETTAKAIPEQETETALASPQKAKMPLDPKWFLESPHLVICGAGHVAAALYRLALVLEYRITILDDRQEFASVDRFPGAEEVAVVDYDHIEAYLPREKGCYYAVLTRGHAGDKECVEAILRKPEGYGYLGMIGSRKKVEKTFMDLREEGFSEEQLADIHAPIGIPLGGQTPAEIAVSIAAQLVQVRNENTGGSFAVLPQKLRMLGEQEELCGGLAVIVRKSGSAPRGEGSMMFWQPSGEVTGTIGGGNLERQVIRELEALWKAVSGWGVYRKSYDVSPSDQDGLDMQCGGRVEVLLVLMDYR